MTDNEIIKALEVHSGTEDPCTNKCPYSGDPYCGSKMAKDALSLIKNQMAEIERLQQKYELSEAEREANVKGFAETLETVRAEAVKEFAEKWKAKRVIIYCTCGRRIDITETFNDNVDIIVKEMTEDEGK